MEPESGARVLSGLPHGFLLQRVAFGLTDTAGFNDAVRGLLDRAEVIRLFMRVVAAQVVSDSECSMSRS
ncbi:hypothetical protein [Streptomyces sp. NPDC059224]|uniref:hypothetical protein n=1 Tax=Streptomyces sp. NPDC059224 TaxID=3346775 RepID=UPI0036B695A7